MEGSEGPGKDREAAQKWATDNKAELQVDKVPVLRLSTIFSRANMSSFGWISVDVEGAEDFVIPTIDFEKAHSDFFSYEDNEGKHNVSRDYLESHGYVHILESQKDHIFKGPVG